jgi:hypothetical protein
MPDISSCHLVLPVCLQPNCCCAQAAVGDEGPEPGELPLEAEEEEDLVAVRVGSLGGLSTSLCVLPCPTWRTW